MMQTGMLKDLKMYFAAKVLVGGLCKAVLRKFLLYISY